MICRIHLNKCKPFFGLDNFEIIHTHTSIEVCTRLSLADSCHLRGFCRSWIFLFLEGVLKIFICTNVQHSVVKDTCITTLYIQPHVLKTYKGFEEQFCGLWQEKHISIQILGQNKNVIDYYV